MSYLVINSDDRGAEDRRNVVHSCLIVFNFISSPPNMSSMAHSSESVRLNDRSVSSRSPAQKPPVLNTVISSRSPARDSSIAASPSIVHRSSFADNLRQNPASPRLQRNHSFSAQAVTDLLMTSPSTTMDDSRFAGRDWRSIQVQEIVDPAEARFVELDTSIEETTKALVRGGAPNVVLVRESRETTVVMGMFGYEDLNAYLLLVLGLSQPDERAARLMQRARARETIPLKDVKDHLGLAEEPTLIPHTASLTQVMEILGSGTHRVVLCKEGTREAVGVLTQLGLVKFFWENHQNFPITESLYSMSLKDLEIGTKDVVAISAEAPLSNALLIMKDQALTSLPVLDHQNMVIGNIRYVLPPPHRSAKANIVSAMSTHGYA